MCGNVALQQRRDLRGTGKHHHAALRALCAGADGFSPSRQQLHDARRYAPLPAKWYALGGNQRCLLGRFRQNGQLPAASAAAIWLVKMGQRGRSTDRYRPPSLRAMRFVIERHALDRHTMEEAHRFGAPSAMALR